MKPLAWLARAIARPAVTDFAMKLATFVDRPLMRMSNGRLRLSFVIPLLLLECRGVRSGLIRRVPLLYVPDGDACLVIASNGGRTRDPAWCGNVRAAGAVTALLRGRRRAFRVCELAGAELDAAWRNANAIYPGYDAYRTRAKRRISVFRLEPESMMTAEDA